MPEEEEEEEEEGPPPSEELAEPIISVRLPPCLGTSSSAGNGFDEMSSERQISSGRCVSPAGNRWPRQETLALLKIRSDMDPFFQEATLKAPLWEQLSRKLTEQGYERSAKKCKEKFENVFKYYKRTKEARAGKSYRFFSQLEALRSSSSSAAAAAATLMASSSAGFLNIVEAGSSGAAASSQHATLGFSVAVQPPTLATTAAGLITAATAISPPPTDAAYGPSSSSNSSSYSGTESEDGQEGEASRKRKRKFRDGGRGGTGDNAPKNSGKLMAFFEGLIQKVMDQQEKMLQRFLEAIERLEQNRMIREEAWRRQEKSRLSREHQVAAQERAAAASRDEAIISCLQKLTGRKIRIPPPPPPSPPPPQETPTSAPPLPPTLVSDQPPKETTLGSSSRVAIEPISSSRWPKSEVHALINLRSGMESRYQESTPKGPLWEEISAGMARLGYNRSPKRCKEKWENINKYFKKVKESNKNRPEDAKTCPYFHQLDTIYRNKLLGGVGTAVQVLSTDDQLALISPAAAPSKPRDDRLTFFEQGSSSVSPVKRPEDIMKKKMMEQKTILVVGRREKQERGISGFQVGVALHMMPRVVGAGTGQINFLAAMVC